MPAWATLGVFALAALALLAVPGPSVLYIVTQSIRDGRRAGLVSMLGIQTGALVHVTAAALGLSALLVSSATAFDAVKFAGAAYLIYLGARRLLGRDEPDLTDPREQVELRRLYTQGIVVNVLNPKTALFFFALLPQFVDPARGPVFVQVLAARAPVHRARARERRALGGSRRDIRRAAALQPRVRARPALRLREHLPRARRRRGARGARPQPLGGIYSRP